VDAASIEAGRAYETFVRRLGMTGELVRAYNVRRLELLALGQNPAPELGIRADGSLYEKK
jgi:hypothetical protein